MSKEYRKISDEKLMKCLVKGDESAFNAIYQRYAQKMHSFFWRMLNNNTTTAEDFTQQLFMKVIEYKGRFDTRQVFKTWLYTIASNMIKNEYRRRERQAKRASMAEHWQIDNSLNFLRDLDKNYRQNRLDSAIQSLDEKHKQCFILKHQQNCSIKEISEIIKCPEGTVKSRLHYAIKQLSEKLEAVRYE